MELSEVLDKMPRNNTTIPTYQVALVGWARENPITPIVLLSLRERTKLDVKIGQPVKVKKGRKTQIATVQMQFKECLGMEDHCSINTALSTALEFTNGDKVKIDVRVTESEYEAFKEATGQAIRDNFQTLMFGESGNVQGDGAE